MLFCTNLKDLNKVVPKLAVLMPRNRVTSPNISELLVYQICLDASTCYYRMCLLPY